MGLFHTKPIGSEAAKIFMKQVQISKNGVRDVVTFAGELIFQRVPGVVSTEVGFTQGNKLDPTYDEVCEGHTGHVEAVMITYDTSAISFDELLAVYWDMIDPTTRNAQGSDYGPQFRSGIYYQTNLQKMTALRSRDEIQKKYTSSSVKTEIMFATTWYRADDFHQQHLEKLGQSAAKGDLTPIKCYG